MSDPVLNESLSKPERNVVIGVILKINSENFVQLYQVGSQKSDLYLEILFLAGRYVPFNDLEKLKKKRRKLS